MKEDEKWQTLLLLSAPTFAGETTPPYGFMTRALAQLKTQKRQRDLMEKIGLRAFLTSLVILCASVCLTLCLHLASHSELEPGMRSFLQVEDVQVS